MTACWSDPDALGGHGDLHVAIVDLARRDRGRASRAIDLRRVLLPKRGDAVTCPNRCRQRLFRQCAAQA